MPTPTNPQGLTAEQMGNVAGSNTIQKSLNNPLSQATYDSLANRPLEQKAYEQSKIAMGPSTGHTVSNTGGLLPTDTNFQAITRKPTIPLVSPTSNPNVLTSSDATGYQEAARSNINQQLADITAAEQQRLQSGAGLQEGVQRTFDLTKQRMAEEQKSSDERMTESQRGQELTQKAINIQQGVAGTEMGNMAVNSLKQEQLRSQEDYADQKKKLLNQAWDSILSSSVGTFERVNAQIEKVKEAEKKSNDDFAKKQKDIIELQKADSQEGGAIYSMVQSGFEPDVDTLNALDALRGYNPGTSRTLFAAEKAIFDRTQQKESRDIYKDNIQIEKDLADLEDRPLERQSKSLDMQGRMLDIQKKLRESKNAAYSEMNTIFDTMKNVPEGVQIPIGDATYFGIDGGAVFEKDKNSNGRLAFRDANGNYQVQNIGNFGKPEDMETVYVNGMQILRNKKTQQLMPVNVGSNAQPGAQVWAEKYPDGSINPYRSGPAGRECAAYCNDLYAGGRVWGNKLTEKLQQAKPYQVPKEEIQVGDTIVMSTNAQWGHTAITSQVFEGENGEIMIQLNESNMIPPGGGKISNSRTMSINDPRLKAVARIPLNPERSPSSPAASLTSVGDSQREQQNPFILPNVVMTPDKYAEAEQKWTQTQTLVDDLLTGADEKELFQGIPADVRNTARRMAKEKEFQDFAQEYRSSFTGPMRPQDVKAEYETFKKLQKGETGVDPETVAQNIFNGTSSISIGSIPQADRVKVDTALANLRNEAKSKGDVLGTLRASAGGKDVSDSFITSYEKAANVLSQIGDIQGLIESKDTGPIRGILASRNPYDQKAREIQAKLTAIVPNLARGVYGEVGVLTDQDIALYAKTLPNLTDTPAVNKAIMSATLKSVANSLQRKLTAQANAGRDVSGYVDSYVELKNQANQLLADSNPKQFRVVDGDLYERRGTDWLLTK